MQLFGFNLSLNLDLVTAIEIAGGVAVILYAVYLGSSMGLFRKSR